MRLGIVPLTAALLLASGTTAAQKNMPSKDFAVIRDFVDTWRLPIQLAAGESFRRVGAGERAGVGAIRRYAVRGHTFGISTRGNVVSFASAGTWDGPCIAPAKNKTPGELTAERLLPVIRSWRNAALILHGKSWTPELVSDQGRVIALLRQGPSKASGKVAYRNYAKAVFGADRCLEQLSVSDVTLERSPGRILSRSEALVRANAWLGPGHMQAVDVSLELHFVAKKLAFVWVPKQVLDDLDVSPTIWVDAVNGRIYPARDAAGVDEPAAR